MYTVENRKMQTKMVIKNKRTRTGGGGAIEEDGEGAEEKNRKVVFVVRP